MKKLSFLLATLLIGGMMFTGCNKDPEPTPEPTPDPTPTTYSVVYEVGNTNIFGTLIISDCFKLDVTYTDADGQSVTETNATLPWKKSIEVTSPFNAKMEGTFVYNEEELPDQLIYGRYYSINNDWHGGFGGMTKVKFLQLATEHPDHLQFSLESAF